MRIFRFVFCFFMAAMVAWAQPPQSDTRVDVPYGSMLSLACEEAFGLNPKRFASAPCWNGARHGDGTPVTNPDVIQPGEFILPAPPYGTPAVQVPPMAPVSEAPVAEEPFAQANEFFNADDAVNATNDETTIGLPHVVAGSTSVPIVFEVPTVAVLGFEFNLAWLIALVFLFALVMCMLIDAFSHQTHLAPARKRARA